VVRDKRFVQLFTGVKVKVFNPGGWDKGFDELTKHLRVGKQFFVTTVMDGCHSVRNVSKFNED
jgi:hypothetical protein